MLNTISEELAGYMTAVSIKNKEAISCVSFFLCQGFNLRWLFHVYAVQNIFEAIALHDHYLSIPLNYKISSNLSPYLAEFIEKTNFRLEK